MYWGETHVYLPMTSPAELLAQAKAMQVRINRAKESLMSTWPWPGSRFDSLNRLASHHYSVADDTKGRQVPVNFADLQAELHIDEFDRTTSKSGSF